MSRRPFNPLDVRAWERIFKSNQAQRDALPWEEQYQLTLEERKRVVHSIQLFELGEYAQGRGYLHAARRYANASGDQQFPKTLACFIREEQGHSQMLGRFLDLQQEVHLKAHWSDSVFRWLRHLGVRAQHEPAVGEDSIAQQAPRSLGFQPLELYTVVLVSAEIIARPYYCSLRSATRAPLLAAICKRILKDEAGHLLFQAGVLRKLRAGRADWVNQIVEFAHRGFLLCTCMVVFINHRTVLEAGGYTLGKLCRATLRDLALLHRRSRTLPLGSSDRACAITWDCANMLREHENLVYCLHRVSEAD